MLIDLGGYDNVVHGIYDAAIEPMRWPGVIGQISTLFEAPRALLFTHSHTPTQGGFTFTHNISQAAMQMWAAKGVHEDPWVRSAAKQGRLSEGKVSLDSELVIEEELLKTDFYKDILQPLNIARVCSGIVFDASDTHKLPTALSLYRSLHDQAFTPGDADVLRRLLAHLSRSLGVMFHLRDSQLQMAASLAALDRLSSGVVLVDAQCKAQFINRAAHAVFGRANTVLLGAADSENPMQLRLSHRLAAYERPLQRAITQALQPLSQDALESFSDALVLPADDGRPACVIHIAPLAQSHGFATGGPMPRAIVFLYDLNDAASVAPALLCKLFDMTFAEARAALQVTRGGSIDEMAGRLGVAANTFKTQLKAAYAKSGTHRQADLLKVLLALASR